MASLRTLEHLLRVNLSVRLVLFAAAIIGLTVGVHSLSISANAGPFPVEGILRSAFFSAIPGLGLAILFARNLSRSLSRVGVAFRAVADGNLESRVAIERQDEIGDLARNFDRLVERLEADREQFESTREKAALTSKALVTAGRLAAVGQLAAGVAHEINNPLTYVRANLGQLRGHWSAIQKLIEDEAIDGAVAAILGEGEELIDESLEGVERAVAIVRDIKGFAHSESDSQEDVELNSLLDSVLRVASPQFGVGMHFVKDYSETVCVPGSGQELKQVFLNLIVNACQAIGESGTIRIETRESPHFAIVHIEDDGAGIEEKVIERIFDPFFTTKPVGQGTGLGLSISHEIIMRHRGEIRVESIPGEGTRFSVLLPLHG
ncbi:MAG: HAMP domain-containing protein [Deltaproteobacteria bacterium]|nr:HAMP domain-containing protein [Deltaproteobacteria bacterium]